MKTRIAVVFALLTAWSSGALAAANWIDWTSTSAGTLNTGSGIVNVTRTGSAPFDMVNGDQYYNNANTGGTSPSGTYGGLAPTDMFQVKAASTFTFTFSQAILNPYIALVSIGQTTVPITYDFNGPTPGVISSGNNIWGTGTYSIAGDAFTGREFNGVLQLTGSFNSLTITTSPYEDWHGFNIGVAPASVPEPGSVALVGLGLLGLATLRRRKAVRA